MVFHEDWILYVEKHINCPDSDLKTQKANRIFLFVVDRGFKVYNRKPKKSAINIKKRV